MEHQKRKRIAAKAKEVKVNPVEKNFDLYNCRAPLVFAIPRMYEDDYERNDAWYFHLKKIERKAKVLKDELQQIAERHSYLFMQSKQLVAASMERRNKLIQKKMEDVFAAANNSEV